MVKMVSKMGLRSIWWAERKAVVSMQTTKHSNSIIIFLLLIIILYCDDICAVGFYSGRNAVTINGDTIKIIHRHDLSSFVSPYSETIFFQNNGKRKVVKSPPLHYIGLFSNERLVIGLTHSITGSGNPQIIVWDNLGNQLYQRKISCKDKFLQNTMCSEYDGGINWYLRKDPQVELVVAKGRYFLSMFEAKHPKCHILHRKISDNKKRMTIKEHIIITKGEKYLNDLRCDSRERLVIAWPK